MAQAERTWPERRVACERAPYLNASHGAANSQLGRDAAAGINVFGVFN